MSVDPLKLALRVEIRAWKMLYGHHLNLTYKRMMDEVVEFQEEYSKRLHRPIKDLEDVRQAMVALEHVRQKQIEIDMRLGPVEVYYCNFIATVYSSYFLLYMVWFQNNDAKV